GVTTAIHASKLARLGAGHTVLVYGTGTVGFGLIQLAKLSGAEPIAVGRSPEKLKMARELGAAHVIDASERKVSDAVREITGGRGVDIVFEMVATRDTMDQSVRSLAKRGRLVFVGYSEDSFSVHPIQLVISEACVTGSVGNTLDELQQAVRLVQEGKMRTVVDRTLPLAEFQTAVDALDRGELVGRAVFTP
ncbi:MAG TPA: zinc-binding dehydrogenase, partial [Thermoanaerobaculia bacterium]